MRYEESTALVATYDDIDAMVEICALNLVENNREKMSPEEFSKKGFLFGRLTHEDAERMIEDKENFLALVLKSGDKALGYLTACDIVKTEDEFQKQLSQIVELQNHRRIFYYKQIAKMPGAKNVGQKLLNVLLDEARKRGYPCVVCKIVHDPYFNQPSISFHEKNGFKLIDFAIEPARKLGIYLKDL